MTSLKSKMRKKLMLSHGARKNTKNTLWITYSHKLNRDIALASNNECIYWVACLEANPQIRSFEFGFIVDVKIDREECFQTKELIKVDLKTGGLELHGLSSGNGGKISFEGTAIINGVERPMTYTSVFGDYLAEKSKSAARWLKLIAFTAQVKNEVCEIEYEALNLVVRSLSSGTVGQLLMMTDRHDPMIILGMISRMAISGDISVDLTDLPFGINTIWRLA